MPTHDVTPSDREKGLPPNEERGGRRKEDPFEREA